MDTNNASILVKTGCAGLALLCIVLLTVSCGMTLLHVCIRCESKQESNSIMSVNKRSDKKPAAFNHSRKRTHILNARDLITKASFRSVFIIRIKLSLAFVFLWFLSVLLTHMYHKTLIRAVATFRDLFQAIFSILFELQKSDFNLMQIVSPE